MAKTFHVTFLVTDSSFVNSYQPDSGCGPATEMLPAKSSAVLTMPVLFNQKKRDLNVAMYASRTTTTARRKRTRLSQLYSTSRQKDPGFGQSLRFSPSSVFSRLSKPPSPPVLVALSWAGGQYSRAAYQVLVPLLDPPPPPEQLGPRDRPAALPVWPLQAIFCVCFALIVVGFGFFSLLDAASSTGAWVVESVGVYTNLAEQLARAGAISDPSGADQFISGGAYGAAQVRFHTLSPQVRAEVISVQSRALERSWQVAIAFGALGLIASLAIKQAPRRNENDTDFGMVASPGEALKGGGKAATS